MNEECRKAIEEYYTLKKDYDNAYKTKQKGIMTNKVWSKSKKRYVHARIKCSTVKLS